MSEPMPLATGSKEGPATAAKDLAKEITLVCLGAQRLLLGGIHGVVIEETRRSLLLIEKKATAILEALKEQK